MQYTDFTFFLWHAIMIKRNHRRTAYGIQGNLVRQNQPQADQKTAYHLEIAGLMSDKPLTEVNTLLENAKEATHTLGVSKDIDPSTVRLTTRGVVDVITQQYI